MSLKLQLPFSFYLFSTLKFAIPIISLMLISPTVTVTGINNPEPTSLQDALNMLANKQRSVLVDTSNLRTYYNKRKRSLNYNNINNEHNFHHDDYNVEVPFHQLGYEDYEDGNDNKERYFNNKMSYGNDDIHLEHIMNENYDALHDDSMQPDIDLSNKKKNVNWPQYFGIDRRRKKTGLYGKPNTQNEDDDWFVKHYYETLVQNLQKKNREMNLSIRNLNKNRERDNKRANKFNGIHSSEPLSRYHENFKNFLMKDQQPKYSALENIEEEEEMQNIKDIILNGLAASYSLQKMQEALNELKNSIRTQKLPSSAAVPLKER